MLLTKYIQNIIILIYIHIKIVNEILTFFASLLQLWNSMYVLHI